MLNKYGVCMLQGFFKVLSIMFFLGVALEATNQEDEDMKLFNAIDQNNFEEVKRLVELGANVNARDKIGYTPLLISANTDNLEIFKYLVEHGADINAGVDSKFGVLHKASMNQNPIILKYLLEAYTLNTNDRGKGYCSALDFSLRNNALQNNGTLENAQLL
jgi:ankyrin repeat protein